MSDKQTDFEDIFEINPEKSDAPSSKKVVSSGSIKKPVQPHKDTSTSTHTYVSDEITYSPSRVNNYKTIRGISTVLKVIAWLSVGVGVLSAIGAIGSYDSGGYGGPGIDFYISLLSVFSNFVVAVFFAALSEGINVVLDIEANSRQTAKTLERLLRTQ